MSKPAFQLGLALVVMAMAFSAFGVQPHIRWWLWGNDWTFVFGMVLMALNLSGPTIHSRTTTEVVVHKEDEDGA